MPTLNFIGGFQGGIEAAQRRQELQFRQRAHEDQLAQRQQEFDREMQVRQQQLQMQAQRDQMAKQEFQQRSAKLTRDQGMEDFGDYVSERLDEGMHPAEFTLEAPKYGLTSPDDVALGLTRGAMLSDARKEKKRVTDSLISQREGQVDIQNRRLTELETHNKTQEDIAREQMASREKIAAKKAGGTPEEQATRGAQFDADYAEMIAQKKIDPAFVPVLRQQYIEKRQNQNILTAAMRSAGLPHKERVAMARAAMSASTDKLKALQSGQMAKMFSSSDEEKTAIDAAMQDVFDAADVLKGIAESPSTPEAPKAGGAAQPAPLTQEDFDAAAASLPHEASNDEIKAKARELANKRQHKP